MLKIVHEQQNLQPGDLEQNASHLQTHQSSNRPTSGINTTRGIIDHIQHSQDTNKKLIDLFLQKKLFPEEVI